MKLNEKITFRPMVDGCIGAPIEGRIIYIHPKRRYYTVEYTGANGTPLRESFSYPHRRGEEG